MAKVISVCPSDPVLEQLGSNQLGQAERETVLGHLEECEACALRYSAAAHEDPLAGLVRQAGSAPDVDGAGALADEIRRLWPAVTGETVDIRRPPQQPVPGAADAQVTTPADASSQLNVVAAPGAPFDFLAPAQQPDELGRLGPYRVLEVLGTGGMGVVFRAEDGLLRRQVALKVMLPGVAADPSGKARFLREARAAASIKHDHVVTIYQVDEERGIPFIAMELLEGESLEKRLERDRKLPAAETLHIAREIAEGLAAAHDLGMVHRDIKPANIWLESVKSRDDGGTSRNEKITTHRTSSSSLLPSSSCRVKILDFGLACDAHGDGRLTGQGVIVGTAAYMSPEQARGQSPDVRGDLFSLGCVLYVMCTGQQPHTGSDFVSTLVSVVSRTPRHVRELDAAVPGEFADLIMKLLEKDPANRPATAHKVIEQISALEKESRTRRKDRTRKSGGHKLGLARKPASTFWKRPRVLLSLMAAMVLLAAGAAWLTMMILRGPPRGVVVVKAADKNVRIRISKNGTLVATLDAKNETTLDAGKYDVELVDAAEGMKVRPPRITVADGQRSEIEVFSEKKKLPDSKLFEPKGKEKPPLEMFPPPPWPEKVGPDKMGPGPGKDFGKELLPPKKKGPKKGPDGPPVDGPP